MEGDCSRPAGSLPDPTRDPGTPDPSIPIEHILVIMQENRSFDHYFGRLNQFGYQGEVDGLTDDMSNPDVDGTPIPPFHQSSYCTLDTDHSWNGAHLEWNLGANDQFVIQNTSPGTHNGVRAISYYDQSDLPYYYGLANAFSIGDRYFCSVLGPTFPNRFFLLTGTAFGHIQNDIPGSTKEFAQVNIFEQLNAYGITWKYYFTDFPYLVLFYPFWIANQDKMAFLPEYYADLAAGRLPQVAFLESGALGNPGVESDEHPPSDPQVGQASVAMRIDALMHSEYWGNSALFLTYDENGGFFDHVPPPPACIPDDIPPMLEPGSYVADYDRYGFRVPLIAVSPYAKRHHVSHEVYDHTSITKFIETKYNLPALTIRDANANPFLDVFDFSNPHFEIPDLPPAVIDPERLRECLAPP
jgi:phospholipase C